MAPKCNFHKRKKTGKDGKSEKSLTLSELEEEARLSRLRQEMLEQRKKDWADCWRQKIEDAQRDEDLRACCAPDEYFRKPRAQTNIWYKVELAKNTQNVEMSFVTVPVPKPKAPAVPRLRDPNLLRSDSSRSGSRRSRKKVEKKSSKCDDPTSVMTKR